MLKKLLHSFAYGAVFALGFGSIGLGMAAVTGSPLAPYTTQGTNPVQNPPIMSDLNGIITQVNNELASWVTFGNPNGETGELAVTSQNAFSANGTVAISAIGSTGVTGMVGVIHEWLAVNDESGTTYYIPVYK